MEDETELDNALLLDAAFQIIDASLDTKALFQEACQLSIKLREESVDVSMSDLFSVTCLELQESKQGVNHKSMLSTPALAKEVIRLTQKGDGDVSLLCPQHLKKEWSVCLELIKESIQQSVFIPGLFSSWISKRGLKLEYLWDLHKVGAYNFHSHLASRLKEAPFQTSLSNNLLSLCKGNKSDEALQQQSQLLTGVTNLLINNSFTENLGPGTKDSKMYLTVLDRLLEGIMGISGSSVQGQGHISPFSNLSNESISKAALKKFTRHALSYCLQYQADFKISERIPSMTKHNPKDCDKLLTDCLMKLMGCLSSQEIIDVLNHSLRCDLINSRTTLAFLAAFLSASEQSGKVMADYVKSSLSTGLQDSDISYTATAFYIARQCCSLNSLQFPSYRDWYQQTLGEASTSPANSKTSFGFLVKCLTTWTPEDVPEYLKVHILRRPYVPPKMRGVYESYVMLAKTRLDDLKIPLRDVANNASNSSTDSIPSMKEQTAQMQQDVENCIKAFEENGKIPTTILEASIFRKPYFVGKFLPAILKPRCLPDKPDSKMQLIEEIRSSGRIPLAMYSTYQAACEKEKKNLLEGVFELDDDDDGDKEMLLSPLEQLQFRLDRFKDVVILGDDKKVSGCIASVEERIHALINQMKTEELVSDYIEVIVNQPMERVQEQIMTKVLCCLGICLDSIPMKDYNSTTPQSYNWFDSLTGVVIRCPLLKSALIKYILICLEKRSMSESPSPECLGAMSVVVMRKCHPMSLKVTDKEGNVEEWKNLADACDYFLSCSCSEDMIFTLSFLLSYLYHAKTRLDGDKFHLESSDIVEISGNLPTEKQLLPTTVVKKICLLSRRCGLMRTQSTRLGTFSQSSVLQLHHRLDRFVKLLDSDFWNRLSAANEPSLKEWILFELRFDPSTDILAKSQRLNYLFDIAGRFVQELGSVSVCTQLYHHVATSVSWSQRRDVSQSNDDICAEFLRLLWNYALNLPTCDTESPWLLSTVRSCQDKNLRSTMLSLSQWLPHHLLLSNQRWSLTTDDVTSTSLAMLDLFADSEVNEGGCYPMSFVIAMIQAASDLLHDVPDVWMAFLSHPMLFTSILVYEGSLIRMGLIASLPEAFQSCLTAAEKWVKRLVGPVERGRREDNERMIEDWMKASVLFARMINRNLTSISGSGLVGKMPSHQAKCLVYLWDLMTAWYVRNMEHLDKPSSLQEVCHAIVLKHPRVVIDSLDRSTSHQREFRSRIGWTSDAGHIHTFCMLRQCSQVAVRDMLSVCDTLAPPLITAYSSLLERTQLDLDIYNEIPMNDLGSISSWLGELVSSSCHSSSLHSVCLDGLHTSDPLLYRCIYLKTCKS